MINNVITTNRIYKRHLTNHAAVDDNIIESGVVIVYDRSAIYGTDFQDRII